MPFNTDNFFMVLFLALFAATTGTAMSMESGSIDKAADAYASAIVENLPNNNHDNNEPAVLAMR
jgi:hypothetical protein